MTDRELDVQIAEQILAIKKIFQPRDYKRADDAFWGADEYSFIPSGKSPRTHMIDAKPVPYFSSDISCAMEVVEKLQGWLFGIAIDNMCGAGPWRVSLDNGSQSGNAREDSLPRAICLAALAASKTTEGKENP